MYDIRKAFVAASLAATALVAPLATPATAGYCPGTVDFSTGAPTTTTTDSTQLIATFDTWGPGYIPNECDLGWVTTCEMFVNGSPIGASCRTHYAPEPDRCPSTGLCKVDVRGVTNIAEGQTVTVRAVLGMTWGCCNKQGGPESRDEGSWNVSHPSRLDECEDVLGDLCRKVHPGVKVLIDDLLP